MKEITLDQAIENERIRRNNQKFKRQAMAIVQKEECEDGKHDLENEYLIGGASRMTEDRGKVGVSIKGRICKWCGHLEQPSLKGLTDVCIYPEEYFTKIRRIEICGK
jgi:hypothetical protein